MDTPGDKYKAVGAFLLFLALITVALMIGEKRTEQLRRHRSATPTELTNR